MTVFTHPGGSTLVVGMEENENTQEEAFIDYLEARNAALNAAAGYFAVSNVPSDYLRCIVNMTTNETIALAARVVLYQRRERDTN